MKHLVLNLIVFLSFGLAQAQQTAHLEKIHRVKLLASSLKQHGLLEQLYFSDAVEDELRYGLANNNASAIDARLSYLVQKMLSDLSRGRVLPSSISEKVTIPDKKFELASLSKSFLDGQTSIENVIQTASPKNEIYINSLNLLQKLNDLKERGEWESRPSSFSTLDVVSSKTRNPQLVTYLRRLLNNFGYANNIHNSNYDDELNLVISEFQADHGLVVDGSVGRKTWPLLERSIDQLITMATLNLDRARWLPDSLGSEYVYVNLANQKLQYFKNREIVLEFKTVVGRLERQTPIMIDRISYVSMNPTWTVTRNMFVKDKLPLLRKDPDYPNKTNMMVRSDITGKYVDPLTIDWSKDPKQLPYTLVQKPGKWNALGYIKFPLTNKFAIYLHDTNERYLFNRNPRMFSSGCVRLAEPFKFAELLFNNEKWTEQSIREYTELNPVVAEKPTDVGLNRKVPVYLYYQTIGQENGKLKIGMDAYGIDKLSYEIYIKP